MKTQISYAANLIGNVEEEHAGGTMAFPSYSLGDEFQVNSQRYNGRTFTDVARDYAEFVDVKPEGYGVDRFCERLVYIPENARASLYDQKIRWQSDAGEFGITLDPNKVYMAPSGYKLHRKTPGRPFPGISSGPVAKASCATNRVRSAVEAKAKLASRSETICLAVLSLSAI